MIITDLKEYFNKPLKGAIHIGAHEGEEKIWYKDNNINPIIWIDADSQYENTLRNENPNDIVIICGVGNENKVLKFNITNNGQSSSFLDFGTHKMEHPDVNFISSKDIEIKTMEQIIKENNIDINNYNFLNVDVQGYELEVLKGFNDYIDNIDYIYTEVNVDYLYENCALINEIDEYLNKSGFIRVKTEITIHKWGDAFYKRL